MQRTKPRETHREILLLHKGEPCRPPNKLQSQGIQAIKWQKFQDQAVAIQLIPQQHSRVDR